MISVETYGGGSARLFNCNTGTSCMHAVAWTARINTSKETFGSDRTNLIPTLYEPYTNVCDFLIIVSGDKRRPSY